MFRKHLKYASYVLRHKAFVFVEACKLGIPLRGALHDLSKFLPDEWFPYVDFFYGKKVEGATGYSTRSAILTIGSFGYCERIAAVPC